MTHRNDVISQFAKHRVAANLLMVMMILAGVIALKKLNIQFFPNFDLDTIAVATSWSGASAEDIESGITIPLEQRLRSVDQLKEMSSSSAPGVSGIALQFHEGTDMAQAMDNVKKQVDDFTNIPDEVERVKVTQSVRYESVARLLISGPERLQELRTIARQFESELLARGIDKVEIKGLPQEMLQISVAAEQMQRLGMGLDDLALRINNASQDLPAGLMGEDDGTREIRSMNKRRSPLQFEGLSVISEQVNLVEDDIAQLYENWFIETCEDWVVPYIGDLVGYEPIHEAGEPSAVDTSPIVPPAHDKVPSPILLRRLNLSPVAAVRANS